MFQAALIVFRQVVFSLECYNNLKMIWLRLKTVISETNMAVCSKCGALMSYGDRFCGKCGSKTVSSSITCSNCGQIIKADS